MILWVFRELCVCIYIYISRGSERGKRMRKGGKTFKINFEHSSLPKAQSKPRHQKHHWAFHRTMLKKVSYFGQFSSEVPQTLSCLALHTKMQLPKASRFQNRTHGPGCTGSPAAASPTSCTGPIRYPRERAAMDSSVSEQNGCAATGPSRRSP